jgi:hypothetical protein
MGGCSRHGVALSAGGLTVIVFVLLILGAPVAFWITGEDRRRKREWRPAGAGKWWHAPLTPIAIRHSITVAGDRSLVELVESRDPRRIEMGRINRKRRKVRA